MQFRLTTCAKRCWIDRSTQPPERFAHHGSMAAVLPACPHRWLDDANINELRLRIKRQLALITCLEYAHTLTTSGATSSNLLNHQRHRPAIDQHHTISNKKSGPSDNFLISFRCYQNIHNNAPTSLQLRTNSFSRVVFLTVHVSAIPLRCQRHSSRKVALPSDNKGLDQ
jgi:hypothetical protein